MYISNTEGGETKKRASERHTSGPMMVMYPSAARLEWWNIIAKWWAICCVGDEEVAEKQLLHYFEHLVAIIPYSHPRVHHSYCIAFGKSHPKEKKSPMNLRLSRLVRLDHIRF